MRLIGLVLILGGVIALLYGGISYWSNSDLLGLQIQFQEFLVVPPIIGGLMLVLGVLLFRSSKDSIL